MHGAVTFRRRRDTSVVELLLAHEAQINVCTEPENRTPLHMVCREFNGCVEMTNFLIKFGADVNAVDSVRIGFQIYFSKFVWVKGIPILQWTTTFLAIF